MANIDEELRLASEASAAIEKKSKKILEVLRKAAFIAQAQQTPTIFLSDAALNKARRKAVSALESLIPALEVHRETSTRMDNAKDAIDEWIKEIKAERAWPTTDSD
jgi:hypothetical protein